MRERLVVFFQRSFAGRCLYRFLELEGVDRALALASRAFVSWLFVSGLAIVAAAVIGAEASRSPQKRSEATPILRQ